MPLVSVIMPTYNCADYICESIDSVISQTLKDWEIEIVDDCSTDNTREVLEPYLTRYPQIHYHRLENNEGPASARSIAIEKARGKYCAFLDADDLWHPRKLERQIQFMEDMGINFSCTSYRQMDKTGNILNTVIIPPKRISYNICLLLADPIGNLTAIYNQEVLGKFIVPSIRKCNDFALWLQVLKRTKYCYGLNEVLAIYRKGRPSSVSYNKIIKAKYQWHLYHTVENHGVIRSAFEMACWVGVKIAKLGKKSCKPGDSERYK